MNCTRRSSPPTASARARARVVLPDAGDVLDEEVAPGEQRDERELDGVRLALEGAFHGLAQPLEGGQLLCDERSGGGGHAFQASTVFVGSGTWAASRTGEIPTIRDRAYRPETQSA